MIPLIAVSAIIYDFSSSSLEEASMEFASIFTSQIVTSIDDFIDESDRLTKSVLVDNDVISGINISDQNTIDEQINQQLYLRKIMMRLMTLKPEIEEVILLTAEGKLHQFSSVGNSVNHERLLEQTWLNEVINSGEKLKVTAVHDRSYYDSYQDGIVLTVSRRIMDYSGYYFGVLLLDIDPASLIELNDDFLLARNRYNIKISITDQNGGILYDSDVASGRITWGEAKNSSILVDKNPEDYIVLSNQTKQGNLQVNAVIPRSSLLLKIKRINYVTVAAVLGCMLIVSAVSVFMSRSITKPVKYLEKNMKCAEGGQYTTMQISNAGGEIGSLIASYNSMILQIKALIENVYLAEIKQKNAKLLALQTQINPHMLYNTLESIRMKALMNGEDQVAEMIQILSNMFKMALNSKKTHYIKDEVEYAINYTKLQNIRYKNQFILQVYMEEELYENQIMALVFQPLIENSIEHGSKGHDVMLEIVLTGKKLPNGDIVIRIEDNGKGMSDEKLSSINSLVREGNVYSSSDSKLNEEDINSIGIKNIAERIRLYYGEEYYLKIISSDRSGTILEMRIPGESSSKA